MLVAKELVTPLAEMEDQLREVVTAVTRLQAQLQESEGRRTEMQQQMDALRQQRQAPQARVGVDTRNLGRPSVFNGTDSAWRDWAVVFRSYSGLVNGELQEEMTRVERLSEP